MDLRVRGWRDDLPEERAEETNGEGCDEAGLPLMDEDLLGVAQRAKAVGDPGGLQFPRDVLLGIGPMEPTARRLLVKPRGGPGWGNRFATAWPSVPWMRGRIQRIEQAEEDGQSQEDGLQRRPVDRSDRR